MLDALYISATGMQAQQLHVDTIANNLANVNTPAFKKSRVSFADMISNDMSKLASTDTPEAAARINLRKMGIGVSATKIERQFEMGEIKQTGLALDVAINGAGFLEVVLADGTRAYSRGGSLKINLEGQLTTPTGQVLRPGISIPNNAKNITISTTGEVQALLPGKTNPSDLGQLELVRFTNPSGLLALGDGLYRTSEQSGEAIMAKPRLDDSGAIVQGSLEGSNVKLVDEMVNLMVAQRAYEASVKVIQASDEMLGMVNALRK
jgi:flagellar basal-body rod protein FlgG